MSFYTTKSSNVERDYIVIRHGIPNVNSIVMGVRFRNSWAVVERNSKTYHRLKQLPMLKTSVERPLSFLKQLPFITRPMDVKLIYGADVYAKYVNIDAKERKIKEEEDLLAEEAAHLADETKCNFRLDSDKLCKRTVHAPEVSSYCSLHLLNDPKLEELEFKIPVAMDEKERKKVRKAAFKKLKSAPKTEDITNVSVVEEETPGEEEQAREQA